MDYYINENRQTGKDIIKEIPLFRHLKSGVVKFEDVTADKSASPAKMLFWIEWARTLYFKELGIETGSDEFVEKYQHWAVHTEMRYYDVLKFLDNYNILTRSVKIKRTSLLMDHLILNNDNDLIAKMSVVMVFIDSKTKKSKPVPKIIKHKIRQYEKENL